MNKSFMGTSLRRRGGEGGVFKTFLFITCGVVWCGVVWCGVVWCGVVWCGVGIGIK